MLTLATATTAATVRRAAAIVHGAAGRSRWNATLVSSPTIAPQDVNGAATTTALWSHQISFASPEADVCSSPSLSSHNNSDTEAAASWSNQLSFASAEADFCSSAFPSSTNNTNTNTIANPFRVQKHAATAPAWSRTLSFASPESDFCEAHPTVPAAAVLPRTLAEAMTSSHAVVVTTFEYPHRIVHVNAAWEQLCGYTQQEVHHQTLSAIVQGDQTNTALADATVRGVVQNARGGASDRHAATTTAEMYVVNYKKNGSPFTNHVRMGPMALSDDQPEVELLVAVLAEHSGRVPLRLVPA